VLVDFDGGRFYFFMIQLWPQEVYFITGLLVISGPGPVPGDRAVRPSLVRLRLPPDGLDRPVHLRRADVRGRPQRTDAARRGADVVQQAVAQDGKHAVWIGVAFGTGGAWIFYFHDAPT
jgi:hypothetical protein